MNLHEALCDPVQQLFTEKPLCYTAGLSPAYCSTVDRKRQSI